MSKPADLGKPYWWDAAPPSHVATTILPKSCDVLVIGAGYTGLSAAITLARRGRSVVVCDTEEIGNGASSRNGGHVGGKLRPKLATLISRYGETKGVALAKEAMAARDYIEAFIAREGIQCDFRNTPRFTGAHKAADLPGMERNAELQRRKLGVEIEVIPLAKQGQYIRTGAYFGGLLDPTTGSMHPGKLICAMGEIALAAGATIITRNPVLTVDRQGQRFEISTSLGNVSARNVFTATNGYSGRSQPYFRKRIIPIGSYLIATEPMAKERVDELMPGCRILGDTRFSASYLHVPATGDRIIYGGRVAAAEIDPRRSGPRLKAVLDTIFPNVASVGISHSWMGFAGFTFDDLPHRGVHDGIHYAMGYCGTSGTSLGVYLGHKSALDILGDRDAATAFDDIPFEQRAYYSGNPWFLSTAVGYYRLRDKLKV